MSALLSVAELAAALAERGVSLRIFTPPIPHPGAGPWIVWAHADDQPELGVYVGLGDTLAEALVRATATWDAAVPRTPRCEALRLDEPRKDPKS